MATRYHYTYARTQTHMQTHFEPVVHIFLQNWSVKLVVYYLNLFVNVKKLKGKQLSRK